MIGLTGFQLPDGGVCFSGAICHERMEVSEQVRAGSWPWVGPFMQGDARAAVAWPDIEHPAPGRVAVAVLDPEGFMRVVTVEPFDRVATSIDGLGSTVPGLGMLLRDVVGFGIRQIAVQADDSVQANDWWTMLRKDPVIGEQRVPADPVVEMGTALRVWREMNTQCIVSTAFGADIKAGLTKGYVTPALRVAAMLALSYKMIRQKRVKPEDRKRWEAWE